MGSLDLAAETVSAVDAAVLITDHKAVDYAFVIEHAPIVIDTRGVYRKKGGAVTSA
jgi:UDP-N-acetyl-D-glucosamine dehydrogenase